MHEACLCQSVSYLKVMDINLAYGRYGLTVTLPDTVDVLSPRFIPGLPDEIEALRRGFAQSDRIGSTG